MHNAWRNLNIKVDGRRGDVLFATEEALSSDCNTSGRFATYDLKGSYNGEGWKNIEKTKFRMKALDTWTPKGAEGATGCDSAHYLDDRGDGLLAYAFYGQGTRFIDASNPKNLKQVGYFRPDDANTFASYWYKGHVYISDFTRGVDVLKFKGSGGGKAVTAPPAPSDDSSQVAFDPAFGYLCPQPAAK